MNEPIQPMAMHVILAGIRQFGLAPDGADLRDLQSAIGRLEAERDRCHARLEIDHAFQLVGKEMVRRDIPLGERSGFPDAVTCRDETITILQEQLDAAIEDYNDAMAERDRLREALIETLAIATRNEEGDFADRARAALAKEAGQ